MPNNVHVQPMTLTRMRQPFSHPEWLYEIKHDGFRALAYVSDGKCELVSRKDHIYKRFETLNAEIAAALRVRSAILDGEIVSLDKRGKSQFYRLMFRRGPARFYAFDILELNGRDLRSLPLLKRKELLKRLTPARNPSLLYVDHVQGKGEELFRVACREDLEGIVAKWKHGLYDPQGVSSWLKIKNPAYTQLAGREELFERKKPNGTEASRKAAKKRAAAVAV
jgi:bifunctional non-homologous end joining protein LigD